MCVFIMLSDSFFFKLLDHNFYVVNDKKIFKWNLFDSDVVGLF